VNVRSSIGVVLWASACVGAPPAPPAGETGGSSGGGGSTAIDPTGVAGSTGGASISTSGAASSGPEPTSSTADGTSVGGEGHPLIVISHGPVLDFGARNLGELAMHSFTVANEGDVDALELEVVELASPFTIASHDCAPTLAARSSCQVDVEFQPTFFGDHAGELRIAIDDVGQSVEVARPFTGRAVGATGNLLINGGGESGSATDVPPMGWTIGYGPNWSSGWDEVVPVEGARTISAGWGPPGVNAFSLHQAIDVSSLTTWGDAAGVRLYHRAFQRSETDGNDPTSVVLRVLDASGAELGAFPSSPYAGTAWNESVSNVLAPPGTTTVVLELLCDRQLNDWCGGFFDGVEVWAEWLG
jgi:hypothetical protein